MPDAVRKLARKHRNALNAALQLMLPLFAHEPVLPKGLCPDNIKPSPPKPKTSVHGKPRETFVGDEVIRYTFRRRRRKSIGFSIDHRGLIVSAPRWITMREIDLAVCEKHDWITDKLAEWKLIETRRAERQTLWQHNGQLSYLGQALVIKLVGQLEQTQLDTSCTPWQLQIKSPSQADPKLIRSAVERWLKERAQELMGRRLEHFAKKLGRAPSKWRLSNARTQWGSCTSDGVIRLNWRLIALPDALTDYVVAHELAHLIELNHSAAFWRQVEGLLPDYRNARQQLNEMPEHLTI